MNQANEKPITSGLPTSTPQIPSGSFGDFGNRDALPPQDAPIDASEELDWLMSLALDDELDEAEAARLEFLLRQETHHADRWTAWQAVDQDFQQMPCVLPSADFCAKFAQRLEIHERQRLLRTGVIFGVAAVALWGSALAGLVMLAVMLWGNQGALLTDMMQNMAYWWTAIGQFGQAFVNTVGTLWSAPQTRLVVFSYVAASLVILMGWFVFLRHSLRETPMVEA